MSWSLGHIALLRSYPPLSRNMIYRHLAALRLGKIFWSELSRQTIKTNYWLCLVLNNPVSLRRQKPCDPSSLFDRQESRALGRVIKIVVVSIDGS